MECYVVTQTRGDNVKFMIAVFQARFDAESFLNQQTKHDSPYSFEIVAMPMEDVWDTMEQKVLNNAK